MTFTEILLTLFIIILKAFVFLPFLPVFVSFWLCRTCAYIANEIMLFNMGLKVIFLQLTFTSLVDIILAFIIE